MHLNTTIVSVREGALRRSPGTLENLNTTIVSVRANQKNKKKRKFNNLNTTIVSVRGFYGTFQVCRTCQFKYNHCVGSSFLDPLVYLSKPI